MVDSSVNQSGRYKAYPEYKHSGVEWLGEIPSSWGVSVMKWCILNNDGGVWGNDPTGENDTIVLRSTEQTVDGKWKIDNPALRKLTPKEKRSAFLKENDLLLTKSSGSSAHIGKTTLVDKKIAELECCYSNFMQRLRVNNSLNPKLVWYLLNNSLIREQFDYLSSTTTGLANLNASIIAETILPICSRKEQNKVVDFLDYETAKIDTLIEKQQRLIELLTEKRQAVISHAVTKGLDPDVPMKASGVEWLGEVPAHWEVKPLKYLVSEPLQYGANEAAIDTDISQPRFVRITDVLPNGDLKKDTFRSLSYEVAKPYMLKDGDVLLARSGGTVGKSFIYRDTWGKCCFAGYLIKARINERFIPAEWFYLNTLTDFYWSWIESIQIQATIQNVSADKYNAFFIAIPPISEAEEIIPYIEKNLNMFDALISKAEQAIQLMQERRTALISAAVTGKIDVRDWVKPE